MKYPSKNTDPKGAATTLALYDELGAIALSNGTNRLMEPLMERMDLTAYLTLQALNSFLMNGGQETHIK